MYPSLFKKRPRDDDAKSISLSFPPAVVEHYPSKLSFPVIIDANFPAQEYCSRGASVKSSIHWGQRKLLLSEIQLLCLYARPDVSYHIVYAGSAPGTHLAYLDEMFRGRHTWELVDPGKFDRPVLEKHPNFTLRNEFFSNATAYGINARRLSNVCPALGAIYEHVAVDSADPRLKDLHQKLQTVIGTHDVARGTESIPSMYEPQRQLPVGFDLLCAVARERERPLLFISDIRSGSVNLPNFEDHVAENMKAQECWCQILQGEFSMLKFRLPYTHRGKGVGEGRKKVPSHLIGKDGTVTYLKGDLLLPIWTRPTSTEGRLVVACGAPQVSYNVQYVENQFFFFNAHLRERVHFNHLLPPDLDLDHHYDAAAEVNCLLAYLKFIDPNLRNAPADVLAREVKRVSSSITAQLRTTFQDAIRRRDALVLKHARGGSLDDEDGGESDGEEPGDSPQCAADHQRHNKNGCAGSPMEEMAKALIAAAAKERARVLWKRNVEESETDPLSGVWVTTKMKQ
ncbi:poly A polymerase regulatory subunit [Trypanosoma brucei equiperdum]|uniref:Cap-specific mRNA (nucleoside-2'-O-)-methyltransferase n=1 Tax=Trypanosoma brucei equiperdum TaxID=630700 RepID=A0A3L6L0V4_9TRYP|nr:poly A polymerase regulatory subunit [Trypanosoma brucei equiperdum]